MSIQPTRIQPLNDADICKGDYVLYWMQQSQRAEDNHALEFAVQQANDRGQGLLVVFGLTDGYPEANPRHYRFMLEGLQEAVAGRGDVACNRHLQRPRALVGVMIDAGELGRLILRERRTGECEQCEGNKADALHGIHPAILPRILKPLCDAVHACE